MPLDTIEAEMRRFRESTVTVTVSVNETIHAAIERLKREIESLERHVPTAMAATTEETTPTPKMGRAISFKDEV